MRVSSGLWTWLPALVAMVAAGAWQYLEFRSQQRAHLAEHRDHGQALLSAVEGVALRECHGGRFVPEELGAALQEAAQRLRLQWVAIGTRAGQVVASAGAPPAAVDPRLQFDKIFEPRRPHPLGRGPRWRQAAEAQELPADGLHLQLVLPAAALEARLAGLAPRAALTTAALATAIALLAGAFWQRTRAAELLAALSATGERVAGLETLRRLGAGLVHETRNPLGVVRGFAERIAQGQLRDAELARTARAIVDETDRTVARLDEFLLLSRPAALRRAPVPVRELFAELAALIRPDLQAAHAQLEVAADDVSLHADRDQLRRLFLNLLLNAVAALSPGGVVTLRATARKEHLELGVEDDGAGVPEALRTTLFEPYVSGRPGGTGLGLAIARRIADDHGFVLRYEPRQPAGTRMVLEVPR